MGVSTAAAGAADATACCTAGGSFGTAGAGGAAARMLRLHRAAAVPAAAARVTLAPLLPGAAAAGLLLESVLARLGCVWETSLPNARAALGFWPAEPPAAGGVGSLEIEVLVFLRMGVPDDLLTDKRVVLLLELFSLSVGVGVAAFSLAFTPGTA